SLQRSGDRFRATARLLNASNGVAAWSGSFDEAFTGVFQIQDQISERVIQQLGPALSTTTAGARFAELGGTHNTDAYQLYLAAQWRSQGGLIADIDRSVAWLNQALAIDPKYALAWSLLAWTHRRRLWNADGVPGDVFAASDHALRQALALAPNLAQARAGVGFRKYWYDFDWDAGEREFRAALAADANEVSAHWGLAYMLLTQGRLDEGYLHLQLARELDPLSPVFSALEGSFLLSQGRLSEARTRLSRTVEIAPNAWLAVVALALLDIKDGQSQKGLDALRRAAQLTSSSRPQALLGKELSHLGRVNEARSILDSLLARSKTQFVPPTHIAIVHAALGETTAAMDALERAYVVRDTRLTQLKDDECWLPLRKEPRFMALRSKLGLDAFGPGLTSV
ncbi:MAG: tetratricopeptide repeat protein, partial [Roseateles sp.]